MKYKFKIGDKVRCSKKCFSLYRFKGIKEVTGIRSVYFGTTNGKTRASYILHHVPEAAYVSYELERVKKWNQNLK